MLFCVLLLLSAPRHMRREIVLYGAGSPRAVLTAITAEYTKKAGVVVRTALRTVGSDARENRGW
jgi:accessory colonization factor AcfC